MEKYYLLMRADQTPPRSPADPLTRGGGGRSIAVRLASLVHRLANHLKL